VDLSGGLADALDQRADCLQELVEPARARVIAS
jgi:hypothetical protein